MPLCLEITPDGHLVSASPQPADVSACILVATSGAEFVSIQATPWNLTTEQASQIGGSILALWALAWVIRVLAGALNSSHQPEIKES